MMRKHTWFVAILALVVGFAFTAQAQDAPKKRANAYGKVLSVDSAAKSFKVKMGEEELTIKYDESTLLEKLETATEDELIGRQCKAEGIVSEDKTSVEAKSIECLNPKAKIMNTISPAFKTVVGTLSKKDGKLALDVNGQSVEVKTTSATKINKRVEAKPEEIVEGAAVFCAVKDDGTTLQATRILVQ